MLEVITDRCYNLGRRPKTMDVRNIISARGRR